MKLRESPSGAILSSSPESVPSSVNVLVWNATSQQWVAGNASVPMQWGALVATAGQFLVPTLRSINSLAAESQAQWLMPRTGYLRAFSFQASVNTTATLRINGVDTAIVLTSAGAVVQNNIDRVMFTSGQAISWAISGPAGGSAVAWCDLLPRFSFTP